MSILIKGASWLVRAADRVEERQDILIDGNAIRAIGPGLAAPPDATVIDGRGKAVIPGLVNAHTHLYQCFLRGMPDDMPLVEWCDAVLFPMADAIRRDHRERGDETAGYHWSLLGAIEMIKGGTTACINMDMTLDSVFRAWADVGFRGVGAITMADRWVPEDIRREPGATFRDTLEFVERWHGYPAEDPLISVMLAPSTPFVATRDLLLWAKEQAAARGLKIQTHVSETRYEVELVRGETGMTPVAYLDSLGLIDQDFVAVHCVHLADEDVDILARHRPTLVHCPKSNMKLGSGIAPIPRLLAAGVPVALGTDGAASNDLLDMFEEMSTAALLQKVATEDAKAISARDVFRMATEGGARACGINAGTLDEGKLADIAIVNLAAPHLQPVHDVLQALVYGARASDVDTTIVNGRIVMRDRRLTTIDEGAALKQAIEAGEDLYRRSRTKIV